MSEDLNARRARTCATTASYTAQFRKRARGSTQRQQEPTVGRIPRVTRMLALAHKIDGMIRAGELRDWAEAARLVGVTRARMTHIANLLLLSPEIQETILMLCPVHSGDEPFAERNLRAVIAYVEWRSQTIA